VIPHAPQFIESVDTSVHPFAQLLELSSTTPLHSSSTLLHAVSVIARGVQSQVIARPGRETHDQLGESGQSRPIVHVREQRPADKQMPDAHSESIAQRAPNAPGVIASMLASAAASESAVSEVTSGSASPGVVARPQAPWHAHVHDQIWERPHRNPPHLMTYAAESPAPTDFGMRLNPTNRPLRGLHEPEPEARSLRLVPIRCEFEFGGGRYEKLSHVGAGVLEFA